MRLETESDVIVNSTTTPNCLLLLLLLASNATALARDDKIDFVRDVQPVLKQHCYKCHSAAKTESGFRLDIRRRALNGGDQGLAIVPGKPQDSDLLQRLTSTGDDRMPPEGERLSAKDVETIKKWIEQGVAWPDGADSAHDPVANHWSWQPLTRPSPPTVKNSVWPKNDIDYFILQRQKENGITPSPPADRATLIRRVFLDVIGLPPSPKQWRRWMSESSGDWYAMLVDELLKSPHYGEHWGRFWLDQARYADSDGYEKDKPRPNAYLYRDWVIDALNQDLPFDQFSIQQLAGDLLPDVSPKTISATGFHRNTLTNNEGGIDREEDRVKQTVDRLNTTFTVWMGLTVQCAQCHSHKYDPISHREYYQLYSFFNDADETSVTLDPSKEQQKSFEAAKATYEKTIEEKKQASAAVEKRLTLEQHALEAKLRKRFPDGRPTATEEDLAVRFPFDGDPALAVQGSSPGSNEPLMAKFVGPGKLTFTKGVVGAGDDTGAIQFDGSGQHLELPTVNGFGSDQPFTCSAWIRPTDNLGAILTKINEPMDFRGIDFTNNKGLLEVHLVDKWPTNAIKTTPVSARLKNDEWQHVLFSYDGSRKAAGVSMFINGEKAVLKVHFDTLTGDFTTEDPWRIGRRKTGTFLKGAVDDVRIYRRVLNDAEVALLAGDYGQLQEALQIVDIPADRRSEEQVAKLFSYFVAADENASKLRTELSNLKSNPPKVERSSAMALMKRAQPRETHVHLRGDFLSKGAKVEIGTPAFLPALSARGERPDRLDFARWLFAPANSLTPRVFVNRIWQTYFGRGLVVTDGDFGTQGETPSHPELLDWLSSDFVEHGWSIKKLHRSILLSATYRQSSHFRPELQQSDPNNALLAYQRRLRVSAETVRDLALCASGQLDFRIKGPSVFPPLPPGVIELAFVDVINRGPWKESTGADRYRRGLYTFFQRTSPYPMLALFDAPDSIVTCTRREKSNTPLQALTMWNDSVLVESARHLSLRLMAESTSSVDETDHRIATAFIICFAREPDERELAACRRLLKLSRGHYRENEQLAAKVSGNIKLPPNVSAIELGAWISVSRALLNLDEFITRQ